PLEAVPQKNVTIHPERKPLQESNIRSVNITRSGSSEDESGFFLEARKWMDRCIEIRTLGHDTLNFDEDVRARRIARADDGDKTSALTQLVEERLGNIVDTALKDDDVIGGVRRMPCLKRSGNDRGVAVTESGKRRGSLLCKRRVCLQTNDEAGDARNDGGGIAGGATHVEHQVGGADSGQLQEPAQNSGLHQV